MANNAGKPKTDSKNVKKNNGSKQEVVDNKEEVKASDVEKTGEESNKGQESTDAKKPGTDDKKGEDKGGENPPSKKEETLNEKVTKVIKGKKKSYEKAEEVRILIQEEGSPELKYLVNQLDEIAVVLDSSTDVVELDKAGPTAQSKLCAIIRDLGSDVEKYEEQFEIILLWFRAFGNEEHKLEDGAKKIPDGLRAQSVSRYLDQITGKPEALESYNQILFFLASWSVPAKRREKVKTLNPDNFRWESVISAAVNDELKSIVSEFS